MDSPESKVVAEAPESKSDDKSMEPQWVNTIDPNPSRNPRTLTNILEGGVPPGGPRGPGGGIGGGGRHAIQDKYPKRDIDCFIKDAIERFELRRYLPWYKRLAFYIEAAMIIKTRDELEHKYFHNLEFVQRALGIKKEELQAGYRAVNYLVEVGNYTTRNICGIALSSDGKVSFSSFKRREPQKEVEISTKFVDMCNGTKEAIGFDLVELEGYIQIAKMYSHALESGAMRLLGYYKWGSR